MSYLEVGFDKLLSKNTPEPQVERLGSDTSQSTSNLTGSNISGGKTFTSKGKLSVDWDQGVMVFADQQGQASRLGSLVGYGIIVASGVTPRIFMGEDGK